ncbi:MAG: GNAT family N-acetyltransferase [Opitutaceae bacterium]|jgi:amino-acid N-acetyltransferase|nr:GNAT family N-acetyltransferase [Opitutaceae bacterium]
MTDITFQFAHSRDESRIIALLQSAALPTADLQNAAWENFILAHQAEKLVGVIGLELHNAFGLVRSLAVTESVRGAGLGSDLLQRIEDHARTSDIGQLGLITDSAQAFFTRHGYQTVARSDAPLALRETEQFRCICPDSAAIMLQSLS